MQTLKTIGVGILGVVVGLLLAGAFQKEGTVGGVYSNVAPYFPAISVGNSNATTSLSFGKMCITTTSTTGNTVYVTVNSLGNLATSSTNCN